MEFLTRNNARKPVDSEGRPLCMFCYDYTTLSGGWVWTMCPRHALEELHWSKKKGAYSLFHDHCHMHRVQLGSGTAPLQTVNGKLPSPKIKPPPFWAQVLYWLQGRLK